MLSSTIRNSISSKIRHTDSVEYSRHSLLRILKLDQIVLFLLNTLHHWTGSYNILIFQEKVIDKTNGLSHCKAIKF